MYYKIIKEINTKYFDNKMSKEWKKFIKELLKKYRFKEQVILELFYYCKSKGRLEQDYIAKVAQSWYKNNIITYEDLENFCIQCSRLKNLKRKMRKDIKREITQFEEYFLEKWIMDYKLREKDILLVLRNGKYKRFDKLDDQLESLKDKAELDSEGKIVYYNFEK